MGQQPVSYQEELVGVFGYPVDLLVCDVIPNAPRTAFLGAVAGQGLRTLDPAWLGTLVYQDAIAFPMWTAVEASVYRSWPGTRGSLQPLTETGEV